MQNFVQRPPNKGLIDFEENVDPNAVIKANTVKLHHHAAASEQTKLSAKPHQPVTLVSEPVDHLHLQYHASK